MTDFLDRISFTSGCPLPVYLDIRPEYGETNSFLIRAVTRVRDRSTGERIEVTSSEQLVLPQTEREAFARVLRLLDRVWMHELRESVQLDGVLVLDPHAGRRGE